MSPTGHVGEIGQNADFALRTEAAARKTEPTMVMDVVGKMVEGRSWLKVEAGWEAEVGS